MKAKKETFCTVIDNNSYGKLFNQPGKMNQGKASAKSVSPEANAPTPKK